MDLLRSTLPELKQKQNQRKKTNKQKQKHKQNKRKSRNDRSQNFWGTKENDLVIGPLNNKSRKVFKKAKNNIAQAKAISF